ncbi:hypothetical protein Cgig2_018408 [Carnegiea gigantea]|uniref:Uncharacterized protein n=1 Tax=Carnegiea gigantea TaxID=171969 RepID=A0A9Q1GT28_9CARY|nr:hypothetical protein Cgig2_018408 [Carnegiea gigantea]
MTMHSFSSVVAQFNEAQAEEVRSKGFSSFLKVDLKQILGKFLKLLVECFDPYTVCFRLLDGQKFTVTTFYVYVTLGVPFGGMEIIQITKSSTDEEYDEVRPRSHYCSRTILKFVKDVTQIASLDWCQFVLDKLITSVRHYKESTAVNRELSMKKPAENKSKEVKQKKQSPRAYGEQQAPDSSKPKLTKEMLSKKDHEKCVGAARTPEKSEKLTKLDSELCQDELLISEYGFGKVKDVDDSCGDKKATRVSMATLKPG